MKFDSQLNLLDHFTPYDWEYMDCNDADLASGGLLLIPGTTEALAGGKTGKLYLVNTTDLGGEQANDAGATQTLWFEPDLAAPYSHSCTDTRAMSGRRMLIRMKSSGLPLTLTGQCISALPRRCRRFQVRCVRSRTTDN